MKAILLIILTSIFLFFEKSQAALIPQYRMDSYAFLSDVVVLCQEEEIQLEEIRHKDWTETKCRVLCQTLEVFKSDWKPGKKIWIEYPSIFRRRAPFCGTEPDPKSPPQSQTLPPGRAALFLKQQKDGEFSVITAKLIQNGQVYRFGQFEGNPGPLVLALQRPENLKLGWSQYNEKFFLEDLRFAVKKSRTLKKAEPVDDFASSLEPKIPGKSDQP